MPQAQSVLGVTNEQASRAEHAIIQMNSILARLKGKQPTARVFKVPRDELQVPIGADLAKAEQSWLSGAARQFYDHCSRRGMTPTVECVGWHGEHYITIPM